MPIMVPTEIPDGLCQCGRGSPTRINTRNHTRYGYVKGEPRRFLRGHHYKMGRTIAQRFWEKVQQTPSCWLWIGGKKSDGYGSFHPAPKVSTAAHRFAWWLLRGAIPEGLWVLHQCPHNNRLCVNPDHLYLGTPYDNAQDAVRDHTHISVLYPSGVAGRLLSMPTRRARGVRHGNAKLTEQDILAIRQSYPDVTLNDLARHYDVTKQAIWGIIYHKTWRHI